MISRRKALGAVVGALATPLTVRAHREPAQPTTSATEPEKFSFTLRIVGSAAYKHTKDSAITVSLPSIKGHMEHEAIAVVEKTAFAVPPLPSSAWALASTPPVGTNLSDLRLLHYGLSYAPSAYYRRQLSPTDPINKPTKIAVGSGGASTIVEKIALASFKDSLLALGKPPAVNEEKWKNLTEVEISLGNGRLQTGPPSRPGLGAGMRWKFPVGWIFKKDPRLILSDCTDFVWDHFGALPEFTSGPLKGISTKNVTVWIVNGAAHDERPKGKRNKLEHTELFWSFYDVDAANMPIAELDADFPTEDEDKESRSGPLMPPAVELCYQGALDF